jgi:hypothetical protein
VVFADFRNTESRVVPWWRSYIVCFIAFYGTRQLLTEMALWCTSCARCAALGSACVAEANTCRCHRRPAGPVHSALQRGQYVGRCFVAVRLNGELVVLLSRVSRRVLLLVLRCRNVPAQLG